MKKEKPFFAPLVDGIIENLQHRKDLANRYICTKLKEVYTVFSCIKAGNDDDLRTIWLEVERGGIRAFGNFLEFRENGEIVTREKYHELWKSYYPEETKWCKFQTSQYRDNLYFYFDSKLIFSVNTKAEPAEKENYNLDIYEQFLDWLMIKVQKAIDQLRKDPVAFNKYISENLPWAKRVGRIKRSDFHDIMGEDTIRPDLGLGKELTEKFVFLVNEMKNRDTPLLQEMTADQFFRLCEIGYDANGYFKEETEKLTPREKYTRMADGRDEGLREINGDSSQAFHEWYHHGRWGGHPWEICRGGNSTHISLAVYPQDGKWIVYLAGSSIGRVEETVRMAVALHEYKIPFELSQAGEIVRMVTGDDYIGIVPEHVLPRYCHSMFPEEDRIIDFMNLGYDEEFTQKIVEKSYWYPLEEIIYSPGDLESKSLK